jgi:hypothetical protein
MLSAGLSCARAANAGTEKVSDSECGETGTMNDGIVEDWVFKFQCSNIPIFQYSVARLSISVST